MFSALNQGSPIYILDRTNGMKYSVGKVIGVTQPNQFGGGFNASSFINPNIPVLIKAEVDGVVRDFPEVTPNASFMSYNGGKTIISENVQGIQSEIENVHKKAKDILANIPFYEQEVADCENIMKQLDHRYAQDKERDERIDALSNKFSSMESKLDKILNKLAN